jgi:Domain of unknown function (DUF4158)
MAGWPSVAQRHELGSFPALAGPEDVQRFFELEPDDLRWALSHRGDARLGAAVLLCSLRWLGFVPEALAELPRPAVLALCEQLEADPDDLVVYGARAQTRSDHFAAARAHAGFRAFDHERRAPLEEWLALRAMEHERPKALWELACEHLLAAGSTGRCRRARSAAAPARQVPSSRSTPLPLRPGGPRQRRSS